MLPEHINKILLVMLKLKHIDGFYSFRPKAADILYDINSFCELAGGRLVSRQIIAHVLATTEEEDTE